MTAADPPITDPDEALALRLLGQIDDATVRSKLETYRPHPWQREWHAAGLHYHERCLLAGNRTGKTFCAGAEVAYHLTGLYPDWWRGRRFDKPINATIGGKSARQMREATQLVLLGGIGEELGTGWIPSNTIHPKGPTTYAGVPGVIDQVKVRHTSGGWSKLSVRTYDQGRERWQGFSADLIWADEEPPMDVYSEMLLRVLDRKGMILMTFTPLIGVSEVVRRFLDGGSGIHTLNVGWNDAPHLDAEEKKRLEETLPPHERDARMHGKPFLGQGAIFPFAEDAIACDPFEIPGHWVRLCGIDFGINHPAAAVWVAQDTDSDAIYVYDCYRQSGEAAAYHARAINGRGGWIPVAWPHDGLNREKSGGKMLAEAYRECGVNMLPESARYDDETGGAQPVEPALAEMYERMQTGRLKVFRHLRPWFEEMRFYHRDEHNRVVAEHDDLMASTRMAVMMIRYALSARQHKLMSGRVETVPPPDPFEGLP